MCFKCLYPNKELVEAYGPLCSQKMVVPAIICSKVEHISFSSGQRGIWQNHEYNIEEILSDWMFKRIKVDSGNGVGLGSEMVKDLGSKLVKEWLGENREYYMEFLAFPEQVEDLKNKCTRLWQSSFSKWDFTAQILEV